jgi:NAD-dependent deacetylase
LALLNRNEFIMELQNAMAARDLIESARDIVVLTGAGISAESGVPTFRGEGGLWKEHRPEELATPQAFARNPELVWEWYDWRRQKISTARPNAAHRALADLESAKPSFLLVTQNVDGLHDLAGSREIVELHGNIWRLRCTKCGESRVDRTSPLPELPPHCNCGAMLRPDVVWFGEPLPHEALRVSMERAAVTDLVLVIGTSAVVYPAAGVAQVALQSDRPVIEINPDETELSSHVTLSLRGKAGEILPELIKS